MGFVSVGVGLYGCFYFIVFELVFYFFFIGGVMYFLVLEESKVWKIIYKIYLVVLIVVDVYYCLLD